MDKDANLGSWDAVQLFLALYRSRTLGEAGEMLGADASTVSRRLSALEERLKLVLFSRGPSGVLATEVAERLYPIAEEMEYAAFRFSGEVDGFERQVRGPVRIACPADAAQVLLVPMMAPLLKRYPQLRPELLASERVVDLTRREADIALRTARPVSGDLLVTRVHQLRWVVAAAPGLARRCGPLRRWSDVPWVGCSGPMASTTPGRWCSETLQDLSIRFRSDSLTIQLASVAAGLGAGLVPAPSVKAFGLVSMPISKRLRRETVLPSDDLFLVSPQSLSRVPRVRAVWEFLVEQVPVRLSSSDS